MCNEHKWGEIVEQRVSVSWAQSAFAKATQVVLGHFRVCENEDCLSFCVKLTTGESFVADKVDGSTNEYVVQEKKEVKP